MLGFWPSLTKCVGINLCKGAQREADAVLGTGEADVPQKRGEDQVLVSGIHAEIERAFMYSITLQGDGAETGAINRGRRGQ